MTVLLVIAGAALGAPARYLTDRLLQGRHNSPFPWGTFAANMAGCALLGFLAALPVRTGLMAFAGTGFCGALTTYSTFGYETVQLARSGARTLAVCNVGASILAGFGAAYCGMAMAQALAG
ncbi:MAG TPA: CrcB family protein [Streptosporangiaceae bacterium]|nr:CrcB family protein [Streptosporangiaceae bacterium]